MAGETTQHTDCRALLHSEFDSRRVKNPTYSLSAFSRFLGISPASLSQILSGKRRLTYKTARKIASRCLFSPEQSRAFLASAAGVERASLDSEDQENWQKLDIEVFRAMGDWQHCAIFSMGDQKPNRADAVWIAEQLGISAQEAKTAFERLLRLGLLEQDGQTFRQASQPLFTSTTRTAVITKYHLQNLDKAREILNQDNAPLELFSAVTMAIDENQLPAARQLIKDFRRRLCDLVESGKRERVYTLSVQLFPVTKGSS